MPWKDSNNKPARIEAHLLHAVKNDFEDEDLPETQRPNLNFLGNIAPHLLTSFYTLRFTKSKDAKTKILYTLNYFRAI